MKHETLFLKLAIILIGIAILTSCVLVLPWIARGAAGGSIKMAFVLYCILIVMAATTIPFFIALYQAFKLLGCIDTNKAFSELSVKALKNIKKCATIISILYVLIMPLFYIVGEVDDAPGVILIGMILTFASVVVAVFAAVLQKLLEDALRIKTENDLTI